MLSLVFGFVILFGLLVAVHEWGHYYAAKRLGIQATEFSLGFGPRLFSRVDRHGTRWQVSLLPLGGYVKFLGDKNGSSAAPDAALAADAASMPEAERRRYFHLRGPGAKAIVIAAGPLVNLVLGVAIVTSLYVGVGRPTTPPVLGEVFAGMPAAAAGLRAGDRILSVNGTKVGDFSQVHDEIALYPQGKVDLLVERTEDGRLVQLPFQVQAVRQTVEAFGAKQTVGRIGIASAPSELVRLGPAEAVTAGFGDVAKLTRTMFVAVGQIVAGERPLADMGGPVKMAEMSGKALAAGLAPYLFLMAVISINLGIFNLLPIPVLDGGGLVVCAIEAVLRRPLSPKGLAFAQNAGAVALITLMIVVTGNDLMDIIHRFMG